MAIVPFLSWEADLVRFLHDCRCRFDSYIHSYGRRFLNLWFSKKGLTMPRRIAGLCLLLLLFHFAPRLTTTGANSRPQRNLPKDGFVPDRETAIHIAQAVLFPIDNGKSPQATSFSADLRDGVWIVVRAPTSANIEGGDVTLRISKMEGCILSLTRGK